MTATQSVMTQDEADAVVEASEYANRLDGEYEFDLLAGCHIYGLENGESIQVWPDGSISHWTEETDAVDFRAPHGWDEAEYQAAYDAAREEMSQDPEIAHYRAYCEAHGQPSEVIA